MKNTESNTLEMLLRVRQFGLTHTASFPADTAGTELLTAVATAINDMQTHSATQAQHARAAKEKTTQKRAAADALRTAMAVITRTAQTMARSKPGLSDKFRQPSTARAQDLLATARAFATEAEPLKGEFIKRGMSPTFLEDLRSRIQAVEQSIDGRAQKSAGRVSATAGVAEAAENGRQAVRELDAVVRNIFADDASALAEWESASRVERAARHVRQTSPAPETAPQQA